MNLLIAIIDGIVGFIRRNPLFCLLIFLLALFAPSVLGGIAMFVLYALLGLVVLAIILLLSFRWRIYRMRKDLEDQFGGQGFGPGGSAVLPAMPAKAKSISAKRKVPVKNASARTWATTSNSKKSPQQKPTKTTRTSSKKRYAENLRTDRPLLYPDGQGLLRPEKRAIYRRRIIYEMESLGLNSIGLTAIISVFIGAVITLQMSINLESPFIPKYIIGYATRETMILEFSSTVVALILAGKVGSSIASEIGTMRITEQIDALEIMGVNSASYLILPKIVATVLFFPFLAILSILIGIAGGYLISALTGIMIPDDYVQGLLYDFRPYSITYTLIKMAVFAFIITSISAFYGYYAKGNSLEVGAASTKAVVASSIVIMIFNLILTQILLI